MTQLLAKRGRPRRRRTFRTRQARGKSLVVPKSLTYSMWNFQRSFLKGTIDTTAIGVHVDAHSVALSDIPNYTEFTALFEQYMINAVEFSFVPFATAVSLSDQNVVAPYSSIPVIMRYTDYDDDNVPPTNEDDFMENGKVRRSLWKNIVKVSFRPKVLTMAYQTALTSGYSPSNKKIWIDTNDYTVPHFGLKVMVTGAGLTNVAGTAGLSLGKLYVKIDVSFKGLK